MMPLSNLVVFFGVPLTAIIVAYISLRLNEREAGRFDQALSAASSENFTTTVSASRGSNVSVSGLKTSQS